MSYLIKVHNYARGGEVEKIYVHPRIHERHPEISEEDVLHAWEKCLRSMPRLAKNPSEYVAVGIDGKGRVLELIVLRNDNGSWLIYHALTPPTDNVLREMGLKGR